jgi:antitoxin ParD1/3/4
MQSAEKMSITLTADMVRMLRETVADGEYTSTSEAIRDAIRVWHRARTEDAERLEAIRSRLRHSIDDPQPSVTEHEVDARLTALYGAAVDDAAG